MVTLEKQRSRSLPGGDAGRARPPSPPSDVRGASSAGLTREFSASAESFAAARVQEALRRLAAHHAVRRGVVDRRKWRLAKGGGRHNPIACYRRADGKAAPAGELLAVGAVGGSVEDLLHGLLSLSPEAMQIESAMTQRDLLDARVLAVLRAPAVHAPFRSLALKWALRNHEELGRHRDYVFLEATGFVDASGLDFGDGHGGGDEDSMDGGNSGTLVGYHLVHSLHVPGAPQLAADMQIVRGAVSYCALFRQRGGRDVELFFRGAVHPQGGARDAKAFQLAAETALATPQRVECGLMKKLAFSLRTRAPPGAGMSDPGASARPDGDKAGDARRYHQPHSSSSSRLALAGGCAVCRRSLRPLFFGKKPPACELCDALACARCRVPKRVFVFQDGLFHPAKMDFCSECVAATTKLSAAWVAAQELALVAVDAVDAVGMGGRDTDESLDAADVLIDDEIQQRLTMSSDGLGGGAMGGALGPGGAAGGAKKLVWLPSDRVRPSIAAGGLSPSGADEYADEFGDAPVLGRLTGKEGASGPPNGLFVPEEDADAIPMIDMPSEGEDDEDAAAEWEIGAAPGRFHRKDQPQTDLSYLY